LHHKYAISDGNVAGSDPSVLTGSHNWSTNAESNSDENTIIIHDYTIANIYLQEFEERWNELTTSINSLADVTIDIFPNPSLGKVSIITESMIDIINIYDIEGKFVQSTTSNNFEISSSGVYFIKITLDNGNYTIRKVIIQ
jgi:phosphatidylserine/phosphatidylglycerophosphate/cardiolipin synthase-like enzyme